MAFWDGAWSAITGALDVAGENGVKSNGWLTNVGNALGTATDWMDKHKAASNIIGNVIAGAGGYFAQKQSGKDLIRQQRELLNLQDQMKSKYSAVPDADWSYKSLTVDDSPGLANGGILTEMKKRSETKGANNGRVA